MTRRNGETTHYEAGVWLPSRNPFQAVEEIAAFTGIDTVAEVAVLRSPNIPAILHLNRHDADLVEGQAFIVVKAMPGGSFFTYLVDKAVIHS